MHQGRDNTNTKSTKNKSNNNNNNKIKVRSTHRIPTTCNDNSPLLQLGVVQKQGHAAMKERGAPAHTHPGQAVEGEFHAPGLFLHQGSQARHPARGTHHQGSGAARPLESSTCT